MTTHQEVNRIDQETVLRILSARAGQVASLLEESARRMIHRNRDLWLYVTSFGVDESIVNPDRLSKVDYLGQLDEAHGDHLELLELAQALEGLAARQSGALIAEALIGLRDTG